MSRNPEQGCPGHSILRKKQSTEAIGDGGRDRLPAGWMIGAIAGHATRDRSRVFKLDCGDAFPAPAGVN